MKNLRLLCTILAVFCPVFIFGKKYDCISHELIKEFRAQSFMFPRPVYEFVPLELDLWHDIIYDLERENRKSFQIVGFYQKALSNSAVARYFTIFHKNTLLVAGDDTDPLILNNRDVRAEWINLPSNFSGYMSLDPIQTQAGFLFEYNQDLGALFDISMLQDFFLGITLPFVSVENRLNLTQSNIQNPGSPPLQHDIISAFQQPAWLFGKIPARRCQTGLAEITFRLGKAYMSEDDYQIAYYSMLRVPTSITQNPAYMFDAFIGNNGHWGFGTGVDFQIVLNRDPSCYKFLYFLEIENTLLLKNHQLRSMDLQYKAQEQFFGLRQKEWSRYMLLTKKGDTAGTPFIPAINVLTRQVRCRPFNMVDLSTGWRLKMCDVTYELGYSLWAHGSENLKLRDFCENDVYGIAGSAPGLTASASTIDNQADDDVNEDGDPVFISIFNSDIYLPSGASRSALVHAIHGSIGVTHTGKTSDILLGLGFFVEFPQKNSALKNIGFWMKAGASF